MSEAPSKLEIYRARAIGSNVNAVTLLATDYLNHFNEALMLAELVADMPDMLDDLGSWVPKHYKDHFRESGVADKDLAIEAYDVSPPEYKEPFESTVAKLNKQISFLQKTLEKDRENLASLEKKEFLVAKCSLIRELIDRTGGIINGHIAAEDKPVDRSSAEKSEKYENQEASVQKEAVSDVIDVSDAETLDQSDIDALFD